MREIKFRARDKVKKIMYYNVQDEYDTNITDYDSFEQVLEYMEVMQYTWLKDKNWVEIYEGDIIETYTVKWILSEYDWVVSSIVERDNEWCDYNLVSELGDPDKYLVRAFGIKGEDIEYKVIGNIYENPDLLTTNTDD